MIPRATAIVAAIAAAALPLTAAALPQRITQLDISNGLSSNYVHSIEQDKNGLVWIATEEGLNRFDGTRLVTYFKDSGDNSISGNELNALLDDPTDSILWIATQRFGLNAYDYRNNRFTSYLHSDDDSTSIITDDVTGISPAADGNLWVATYWRGVDLLDKTTRTFTHYNCDNVEGMPADHIWCAAEIGEGYLFVGHTQCGLSVVSIKDRKAKTYPTGTRGNGGLRGHTVYCICRDRSGNIWLGTETGLALFDPMTETFFNFADFGADFNHSVFGISQFSDNSLWVAMEFGGIMKITLSQTMLLSPDMLNYEIISDGFDDYSLNTPTARCLMQDSFGNVWAGTWGGGVNFIGHSPAPFNVYRFSPDHRSKRSLNNRTASSLCVDRDGRLWVGTDGDGLNVLDRGERVAVYDRASNSLGGYSVLSSLCDGDGNLWFGSFFGDIDLYDTSKRSFVAVAADGSRIGCVRSLYADGGHIWACTDAGLYKIDTRRRKIVDHITFGNSLARCMLRDSEGRYWVGTFGEGLTVYDSDFQWVNTFNVAGGFPSNTINALHQGPDGSILAATGEGLVRFPSASDWNYTVWNRSSGLENSHVLAVISDTQGNIWLSTNKGLSCILADKSAIYNYDTSDNVPMGSFMSGCAAIDHDGILSFGSINGLCFFDPAAVLRDIDAPQAIITDVTALNPFTDEGEVDIILPLSGGGNKISLPHQQNCVSVSVSVADHSLAPMTQFAYMLSGFQDTWFTPSDPNRVVFRNLPPGHYRLNVRTRLKNRPWADSAACLEIIIRPPMWLTWWAKCCYAALAAALIAAALLAYRRHLVRKTELEMAQSARLQEQELNNERLRFYTNITHELRTPLTLILGPLEDLAKSSTLHPGDSKRVKVIHQSATKLLGLVNQLLEFRKTETRNRQLCVSRGDLAALVSETSLKFKELNRNKQVEFIVDIESGGFTLYFDKEVVATILDNLLSNAVKYTTSGYITVSLRHVADRTQISVSDTGCGISPEALPRVFDRYYQERGAHQASGTGIGLALVRSLATLHEGEISATSEPGQGSVFTFSILTDNTYPDALHTESQTPDEASDGQEPTSEAVQRPILLIVEDNLDICEYVASALSDEFATYTAGDGAKGLAEAQSLIPDIIVSDIMMPAMSGTELCQRLKSDTRTSHIPVILLTAKDTLQDKEEGYQSGADSYLTKPFSASLLRARIHNLLEQRAKLAERFAAAEPAESRESWLGKVDNEFLDKMNRLITDNMSSEKVDIDYLAESLYMSPSTLYRKMKALTGMSTSEYVRKIRMRRAAEMLSSGHYNVSQVAFMVGFGSAVYFRQCFKEEFGVTPSDYQKLHNQ